MKPAAIEDTAATLGLGEANVRRNIVSTLGGNVVFSASQWLITVAIARMGSIGMVGQYALGIAACTPIFAFTGLQLRAVLATDCDGTYRFPDYLTLRLGGTACALLAVAVLAWLMPWERDTVLVVFAVACLKAVDSFSDVLYGLFQLRDRLDLIARAMVIRGVGGVTALAIAQATFHNAGLAVLAMAGVWLAVLLMYERPIAKILGGELHDIRFRVHDKRVLGRLLILSLPLAFVLLLLSGVISLPRVVLERFAGERALGVFSVVAAMSGAIGLVYSALGQTALPRLARMFAHDHNRFRSAMGQMMLYSALVGLVLVIGAWYWGVRVVAMVYGHQDGVTAELVTGLVAAGVVGNTASLLGVGLTASRRYLPVLAASAMIFVVTAAASAWWIPAWGVRGAMYAGLTGVCFQLITFGYLCWQEP